MRLPGAPEVGAVLLDRVRCNVGDGPFARSVTDFTVARWQKAEALDGGWCNRSARTRERGARESGYRNHTLPKVKVAALDCGRWASRRISLGYEPLANDALWP